MVGRKPLRRYIELREDQLELAPARLIATGHPKFRPQSLPRFGETFAALVSVQGDEEYEHSRIIDFEAERIRRAAAGLLEALQRAEFLMRRVAERVHQALSQLHDAAEQARTAIA